jgi:autotransporter-associated beta strand protein
VLKGANTYSGITGITRGTLFMGAANSLPAASVLDVHWSNANNTDYAALDLCGFDQTVGGLQNSGFSGNFAVVTNSSATLATLVVNQTSTTVFSGLLAGKFALVKSGSGSLSLTNRNVYSGSTTVSGGTLRLGVNGAIPSASKVVLSGGALDVSGTTNTVASLTVVADSTLSLGTGTLAVSAQGSDAWTGSLTVTGTLGATSLRFQSALSASQLAAIRNGGKRVMQNADGSITPWYGTIVLVN